MKRTTRKVDELRPHPRNAEIYHDGPDEQLLESMRKDGFTGCLLITGANVVISGHRRLEAARMLGLTEVPVEVFHSRDDLDVLEALVRQNAQRERTTEQKAREFKVMLEVEQERARRRQAEAARQTHAARRGDMLVETFPQASDDDSGKARDKAAAALQASGKTLEKAAAVVDAIDALEERGHHAQAEEVRTVLNKRGADPALKLAGVIQGPEPAPAPAEAKLPPVPAPAAAGRAEAPPGLAAKLQAAQKAFMAASRQFGALQDAILQLAEQPGGEVLLERLRRHSSKRLILPSLERVRQQLLHDQPYALGCPTCSGGKADCRSCKGRGWVSREVWKATENASEVTRSRLQRLSADDA